MVSELLKAQKSIDGLRAMRVMRVDYLDDLPGMNQSGDAVESWDEADF